MDGTLKGVCVFCGSREGFDGAYAEAARAMGKLLAQHHIRLVYGGGAVGLMGVLATAALDAGGEVMGVIPRSLVGRELSHPRLQQLHVVDSMHARKQMMAAHADGFIAMPGGFGTLDELFEITTWAFLGLHTKPVALVNTESFFDPLLRMADAMIDAGFAVEEQKALLRVCDTPAAALAALRQTPRPPVSAEALRSSG